jgi:DNA repair protein RecO (recombination protein O)
MPNHISPAIILRAKDLGESDILVNFFTVDKGRLKGIAKGAKRRRRRFVNSLDIFSLVSLEYDPRGRGELVLLHSGKLINSFFGLRRGFLSLSLAGYMIELTETLFPLGVADRDMFELLKYALSVLDEGENPAALRVLIEARAMALGGYGIGLERCCRCGRSYAGKGRALFVPENGGIACMKCACETPLTPGLDPVAIEGLQRLQSEVPAELSLSEEVVGELRKTLKLHLSYRLGREFKTCSYLGDS